MEVVLGAGKILELLVDKTMALLKLVVLLDGFQVDRAGRVQLKATLAWISSQFGSASVAACSTPGGRVRRSTWYCEKILWTRLSHSIRCLEICRSI